MQSGGLGLKRELSLRKGVTSPGPPGSPPHFVTYLAHWYKVCNACLFPSFDPNFNVFVLLTTLSLSHNKVVLVK